MILGPLYHWSPAARHDDIHRDGIKPGAPSTVASVPLPYVCLGFDPASAWAISGAMEWVSEVDKWDLWLVRLGDGDSVQVRPDFGPRLQEVKVHNPIPADRLWWVGRRDT